MGRKKTDLRIFLDKFAGIVAKAKGLALGTAAVGGAGLYGLHKITEDPDYKLRDLKYEKQPQADSRPR